jgi:predicted nucleotidyltransferase
LKIPVLLIGGFAVNFYKISRQTADVDFLIDKNEYHRVKIILTEAGYEEIHYEKLFARFSNKSDQLHFLDIDFMFVNYGTLEEMINNEKEVNIAKCNFTVPSLNHLIALKLHSIKHNPEQREYNDLLDILNLVKKK